MRDKNGNKYIYSYSTSPDRTMLLAQHFWSSGLLCRWSDSLELATGQSPWPGAQQQQFQTIAEDEPISSIPLSTHSTVEMLHDSALYKSIIDIDIWQNTHPFDCRTVQPMTDLLGTAKTTSLLSSSMITTISVAIARKQSNLTSRPKSSTVTCHITDDTEPISGTLRSLERSFFLPLPRENLPVS